MSKSGHVLKVVEMCIENDVYEAMKQPNFSVEALTRKLNSKDIKITAQSIRKFIKKTKKAQQEIIQKDLRASEVLKTQIMDYSKALKDILTEVEELKNEAKDKKDLITYNQLVGRLYQGIELIAKLSGDMKPKGSIDINIIYNEINADVEKKMKTIKNEIYKDEKIIDVDVEIEETDLAHEKEINEGE